VRQYVKWGFVVIGIYLAVDYATGFQGDAKAGASGISSLISAFQGKG
jgi:hypothetical protein